MNRYVLLGAVALMCLLGAFVFSRVFQQVSECEYTGYQGEARRNEHLAAERFLQRIGHPVHRLSGLDGFQRMPVTATLFWSRVASEGERERLLEWIKRGGHVIVGTPYSQDALLGEVGVEAYQPEGAGHREMEQDSDEAASPQADNGEQAQAKNTSAGASSGARSVLDCSKKRGWPRGEHIDSPAPLSVRAGPALFQLALPASRLHAPHAQDEPLRSAADERGAVMLEYSLGRGRITVLTSGDALTNDAIGEHDHAAWLRHLTAPAPGVPAQPVWFADVPLVASLWDWLKQHAWPVLITAAIAIALGLWRALVRFGPLSPDSPPGRLSFRDHLVACGRFHWRHGAAGHLLHSVEQEAQRLEAAQARQASAQASGAGAGEPPLRRLLGRASEAPGFVQSIRALQRKLSAKKTQSKSRATNTLGTSL